MYQQIYEKEIMEEKYEAARKNLLLMLVLTVINIVLVAFDSTVIMLFSATIPYYAAALALMIRSQSMLILGLGLAIILLLAYFLCWYFSKKHYGWMIFALILFIVDTIGLILIYILSEDISGVLDLIMHIWILYYLVIGVINGYKLKDLPVLNNEEAQLETPLLYNAFDTTQTSSNILRKADFNVKSRILLETDYNGHQIIYRRVKRTNELVIDGNVYSDVTMLVEKAHALSAHIGNHTYEVGFDGVCYSYIKVDGQIIEKKVRVY